MFCPGDAWFKLYTSRPVRVCGCIVVVPGMALSSFEPVCVCCPCLQVLFLVIEGVNNSFNTVSGAAAVLSAAKLPTFFGAGGIVAACILCSVIFGVRCCCSCGFEFAGQHGICAVRTRVQTPPGA